jgi:hypothetical protein
MVEKKYDINGGGSEEGLEGRPSLDKKNEKDIENFL